MPLMWWDSPPEREGLSDVKVVRSWQHTSRPEGHSRRLAIPRYVSETLYGEIEAYLPRIAQKEVLRRALVYLKLVAVPEPRSGHLPFHEKAVARIRGVPSLADRNEAKVYALAEQLQSALKEDLLEKNAVGAGKGEVFTIVPHSPKNSCVQITRFRLQEPVEKAFEEERGQIFLGDSARNLQTGNKKRPEDRKSHQKKRRRKAEKTARQHEVPERLRRFQRQLHELPRKRFTSALTSAADKLTELVRARRRRSSHPERTPYFSQLRTIAEVVVPLYKFTGRTLRLTSAGPSLASLPTKMRRAVFDDYLEVDMSSAQLALAASLWQLSDLREFLKECRSSDKSWWSGLIGWLRQELPARRYHPSKHFEMVKGVLKGFTYGLFYGMQPRNLRRLGNPHAPSTDPERYYKSIEKMTCLFLEGTKPSRPRERVKQIGDALFRHPLVEGLMQKREQLLSSIKTRGGKVDCFGRLIETTDDRGPKSVLAEFMQNAELKVMLPVGETVLADDDLRFGLWQHDGVTIAPRRRKPWAYRKAVEKTREALQKGCRELEKEYDIPPIETELTVDYGEKYLQSS